MENCCHSGHFLRFCLLIDNLKKQELCAEMSEKIEIRNLLTMQPHTILWDTAVKGFNARRQRGDAVTFSVFYRTLDGQQRWHRVGRFGVWTPEQARKEAQRVLRARDLGEDPAAREWPSETLLRSQSYVMSTSPIRKRIGSVGKRHPHFTETRAVSKIILRPRSVN